MLLLLLAPRLAAGHVPLAAGDWTITELHAGPAEEGGQWFEVRNNNADDGSNLVEQGFADSGGHSFIITGSLVAREGEYAVLASEDSTVEADFRYPSSFVLAPEAGSVALIDHITGLVDRVAWDSGWALSPAAAVAVNPGVQTSAWANDLPANWCVAAPSPGAENAWCPGADTDDDGDGVSEREGDCDDGDGGRAPGLEERRCDALDQDCDGQDLCPPDSGLDGVPDSGLDSGAPDDPGGAGAGGAGPASPAPGCGCASGGAKAGWLGGVAGLLLARLRRVTAGAAAGSPPRAGRAAPPA